VAGYLLKCLGFIAEIATPLLWVAGCLLTALIDCVSRDTVALNRLNAPTPDILVKRLM
jgi:hypothetical protein